LSMSNRKGMIYIFEGDGKGKTSAALGVTLRMLLLTKKVVWISWFKEESWKMAETSLPKVFEKNLKMYWMGKGFFGGPMDHDTPGGHKKAAVEALSLAKNVLEKNEECGGMEVDLLVLDEVMRAVQDKLITIKSVLEIIEMRGKTHLVLTGHKAPVELIEKADLVTEMKKVKHPYDKGVLAIPGLDF
jgi:cob(I)alamin adenosyltransferase